jgi:Carbonic anhydrase
VASSTISLGGLSGFFIQLRSKRNGSIVSSVVVTCMDTRIDVFRIFGLDPGDAHVLRNAGGLVTDDVLRSLVISQRLLGQGAALYGPRACDKNMMTAIQALYRDDLDHGRAIRLWLYVVAALIFAMVVEMARRTI